MFNFLFLNYSLVPPVLLRQRIHPYHIPRHRLCSCQHISYRNHVSADGSHPPDSSLAFSSSPPFYQFLLAHHPRSACAHDSEQRRVPRTDGMQSPSLQAPADWTNRSKAIRFFLTGLSQFTSAMIAPGFPKWESSAWFITRLGRLNSSNRSSITAKWLPSKVYCFERCHLTRKRKLLTILLSTVSPRLRNACLRACISLSGSTGAPHFRPVDFRVLSVRKIILSGVM